MNRSYLTKPLTLIGTFIVLVVALLVVDGVGDRLETRSCEFEEGLVAAHGAEMGARLEAEIYRALLEAQGLAMQALADDGVPVSEGHDSSQHLRAVVLVTPGQASRILRGDDAPVPPTEPALVQASESVQTSGRAVMAGPFATDDGQMLVFVMPADAGTVHVTLKLASLLRTMGLSDELSSRFALRSGTSSADAMLFGQPSVFADAPVRLFVTLPGGNWELAAVPDTEDPEHWQLRIIGAALALVITLLAYVLLVAREREKQLALHDPLTGLPNRLFFDLRLDQAISRAERHGRSFTLLLLDLDDFKPVNDVYGHKAGDRVLIETGRRIRKHLRRVDTVARIGGDEFMVILDDTSGPAEAEVVARKLIAALGEPINVGADFVCVGVSIGGSFYPESGTTAEQLIRRADQAMYCAKARGKNRFSVDTDCLR